MRSLETPGQQQQQQQQQDHDNPGAKVSTAGTQEQQQQQKRQQMVADPEAVARLQKAGKEALARYSSSVIYAAWDGEHRTEDRLPQPPTVTSLVRLGSVQPLAGCLFVSCDRLAACVCMLLAHRTRQLFIETVLHSIQ